MRPLWWGAVSFLAFIGNLDTIRDWCFPDYKDLPILSFFPDGIPWSTIAWVGVVLLVVEGGYRAWSKERQKHTVIPLEVKARAFNPVHDLYGVCLEVINPPSNMRNMEGIRAVVLRGEFDGFDLAGTELGPANEPNKHPTSLNPGDYLLLMVFSAKNNIHFISIAFPFKNQAGKRQAFTCNGEAYGEVHIRVTAANAQARDVKLTWHMNDGQFTTSTSLL